MRSRATAQPDRGASMVEGALILPVLLLVMFGLVEFAIAFNAQVTLTHAAREGVREYALTQDLDAGRDRAVAAANGLDPALLTVSATACDPGQQTELTVSYPFSYEIPFWGSSSFTMEGKGVMRCTG